MDSFGAIRLAPVEVNKKSNPERGRSKQRNRRPPNKLSDIFSNINKFFALFDGTSTVHSNTNILEKAYKDLYCADAVTVTYSAGPLHHAESVLTFAQMFQTVLERWTEGIQVDLCSVSPLAPSVIEYTLKISVRTSCLSNISDQNTSASSFCSSSSSSSMTVVCTATLREGKIISCVEKKILELCNHSSTETPKKETIALRDGSLNISELAFDCHRNGSIYQESSLSSNEHCSVTNLAAAPLHNKGTTLENVVEKGGAIFLNQTPEAINIKVVTEQNDQWDELELVDFFDDKKIKENIHVGCNSKKEKLLMKNGLVSKKSTTKKTSSDRNKKSSKRNSLSTAVTVDTSTTNDSSEDTIFADEVLINLDKVSSSGSVASMDLGETQARLILRETKEGQKPVVLCRVKNNSKDGQKQSKKENAESKSKMPLDTSLTLWEQIDAQQAEAEEEQPHKEVYYIDGREPLFPHDPCVARFQKTKFYPRYQYLKGSEQVLLWNGTDYEPYLDTDLLDIGASERKEAKKNVPFMTRQMAEQISSNQIPQEQDDGEIPPCPDCFAEIAKRGPSGKGQNKMLRAKIKVPSGGDPSLMIVLTFLSDYHRDFFNFTKIHVRENPFATQKRLLLGKSISASNLLNSNSCSERSPSSGSNHNASLEIASSHGVRRQLRTPSVSSPTLPGCDDPHQGTTARRRKKNSRRATLSNLTSVEDSQSPSMERSKTSRRKCCVHREPLKSQEGRQSS